MAQAIKICLLTALWYGALSALVIYGVAPRLADMGYGLRDNMTVPAYQRNALRSAAIGYPLLCVALVFGDAYRRKNAAPAPLR